MWFLWPGTAAQDPLEELMAGAQGKMSIKCYLLPSHPRSGQEAGGGREGVLKHPRTLERILDHLVHFVLNFSSNVSFKSQFFPPKKCFLESQFKKLIKGGPLIRVQRVVGRCLGRPLETSLLWRENQQPHPTFSLLKWGAGSVEKGGSLLPGRALHEISLPREKGQVLNVWRTDLIEETLQWKPKLQNGVQTMGRDLEKVQVQRQLADRQRKGQVGSNGEWGKERLGSASEGFRKAGEKTDG